MFDGEGLRLFGVLQFRFADFLDIVFVAIVLYYFFLLFRGTRAVQMFAGFVLLGSIYLLSLWWDMKGISWLFSNLATVGIVALVILFQPELRSALTRLGQSASRMSVRKMFFHEVEMDDVVRELVGAAQELSRNSYGALIAIEQKVGLKSYIDTGEPIEARVGSRLLRSLFFPNSPLHDGAVIISKDKIVAAGCVLPVQTGETSDNMGMRHRAAKTLAGESDALVIVVSEETGAISLAYRNTLRRKLSIRELEEELKRHMHDEEQS